MAAERTADAARPLARLSGAGRLLRRRLHDLRSLHALHWAIIALSLVATVSAWSMSRDLVAERNEVHFEREAEHLVALVTERLGRYEDALQAGLAVIAARGGDIDRASWRTFAENLRDRKRYEDMIAIGVIRRVPADELDAFVARQRTLTPGYDIHPERRDATDRYPVVYVEPERRNRSVIGLDLTRERKRLRALARARATTEPQMTAPIALVQDGGESPGFLFFASHGAAPTSAAREGAAGGADAAPDGGGFDGLVYAAFVARSLMGGVLARERRQVWTSISDAGETILDEHDPRHAGHDPEPMFSTAIEAPLYGRTWRFDIQSNLAFREALPTHQPSVVLLGGVIIDVMLLGLFFGMARTRRAMARVADMNVALERKAEALIETNRDLERFACVVSHDLKTPLRGMADLIWYLEEDLAPYLAAPDAEPGITHNLGRLNTQVRRMNALIEGILDYSAAGQGQLRLERVDTAEVFAALAEELELDPGQLVVAERMPVLTTCRTRLEQVMGNLVGNAFKYHPERAAALVRVHVMPLGNGYRFSIADNGPGIDPRFRDRIFEMFQTLRPKDDTEATGIGLAIVRKCVESIGGAVRVGDTPGGGATFHVDWPIVAPTAAAPRRRKVRDDAVATRRRAA